MNDPFSVLGLSRSASADDVRSARRELAKRAHPDVGGDGAAMRAINDAAAAALRAIASSHQESRGWDHHRRDVPSFTVEALPVETFEALLLAAAVLGEVEDDDPPYGLSVLLSEPLGCWCHLSIVPDAGASTVSVTLGAEPGRSVPPIERVRDAWISELNALDWSALG